MNLHQVSDAVVRATREAKEAQVKLGESDNTDVLTCMQAYRGSQLIAAVFAPPNRDTMLYALAIMASGFCADIIAVVHETWHSWQDTNPKTGEPWGQNEMQQLVEEDPSVLERVISAALMVEIYNRAGDSLTIHLPYSIAGGEVLWGERFEPEGIHGRVPEALENIMAAPTVMEHHGAEMAVKLGLDPDRAQFHSDMATVRWLTEQLGDQIIIALAAVQGTERAELLKERFKNSPRFENHVLIKQENSDDDETIGD